MNRDKIEMVAYFGYMQATIGCVYDDDSGEAFWRRKGFVPTQKIEWGLVREFYEQLCDLAETQLGVRKARDNKVTFIFTDDGGRTLYACNFYDSAMTMCSWYPWLETSQTGNVPQNFDTNKSSMSRVEEAVQKWADAKKVQTHAFSDNLSCSLF